MPGLYYEEYEIGVPYRHDLRRTVTDADNLLFTALAMNSQPLHLDEEFAKTTPYGERLVTSAFTIAVVIGMTTRDLVDGTSLGNLGFSRLDFPAPVFIGDTLRAESEITAKRLSRSRPGAGVVTFVHRGYKQDGTLVMDCERKGLAMCRPDPEGA